MYKFIVTWITRLIELISLPFFFIVYAVIICIRKIKTPQDKPRLVWGADPIINNKYWSQSMQQAGYKSITLMHGFYASINSKKDYDRYLNELLPLPLPLNLKAYYGFLFSIANFDIIHHPAHGYLLRFTFFMAKFEGTLIKLSGCKNIVLPYGSDIWMYSKITNLHIRHSLLLSYPYAGKNEEKIKKQIAYWIKNSSVFFPGLQTDGIGYWDLLCYSGLVIDEQKWLPNEPVADNKNGVDDVVKLIHTPNHRGVKGTEFILDAVATLKNEGLKIELILLEKISNDEVKRCMGEADILVEQLVVGYGLSAVEGMAKGLVVISNLDDENRNGVFRTYSYFNECPVVSANHHNVTNILRSLIKNPQLRRELGDAGRAYVQKYHSYQFGQYVFGQMYKKIWTGEEIDLLNMFHPLGSNNYNNNLPIVKNPLNQNKLPV